MPQLSNMQVSLAHELVELAPGKNRNSTVTSINEAGQAVGVSNSATGQPNLACRWTNGAPVFLPDLGGITGQAIEINSAGRVVGQVEDDKRYARGCVWDDAESITVLEVDGAYQTAATCVIDSGAVGGWASFHPSDRGQLQNRPAIWAADGSPELMPKFTGTGVRWLP